MCKHAHCPIETGRCITEKPGWEWAEKFGLPDANPTQRRFLIEQSARWGEITVREGEPEPNALPPLPSTSTAYPGATKMVANLAGSVSRFVGSGLAIVDREEFDRRRRICTGPCPTGKYDAAQDRCRGCGCYLAVKPWGRAESCPDGHW